jgi:deoxyribodipyrimidine photo-lyase
MVDTRRVRALKEGSPRYGPVVYWMSRDQRASQNWALLFAQQLALQRKVPLFVIFCLVPKYLGASRQHYEFMLQGLQQVESKLNEKHIAFRVLSGQPEAVIPPFITDHSASALVGDFSPLRTNRAWKSAVAEAVNVPFYEVDGHNVIPCWIASNKLEYAARTIRPKIQRALKEFLIAYPALKKHPCPDRSAPGMEWEKLREQISGASEGMLLSAPPAGENAARSTLRRFLKNRIQDYDRGRNDPTKSVQSDLSPYLHFGQISAQQVAIEVYNSRAPRKTRDRFLEELIVRRELSDNFCLHNHSYDSFDGFPRWAKETLNRHRNDPRPFLYSLDQFEKAATHDPLWNAAQKEMLLTGKMHGYMRMYWAKKILEWSESPESAIETAIQLNDRYELDGRDPNGYAGIAWSIGGVHDRPWFERPVFGTIRYMSYNGCKSKFDVDAYIERIQSLTP